MSDSRAALSPVYACLYRPPSDQDQPGDHGDRTDTPLVAIAQEFSPRYERHGDDLASIDVSGLERLLGAPRPIGVELARTAAAQGVRAHVALASRRTAALVLAVARPGLTVVDRGREAAALAPLPVELLAIIPTQRLLCPEREGDLEHAAGSAVSVLKRWGITTLGALAALPPADLVSRLGRSASIWQALARGDDSAPLVPMRPDERFESSIELDWPIEGLEPLSFVLTRLLEPLSTRLERADRGAAQLHVGLRLVTRDIHARRLQLPAPIRDVRTLRTLALLDLESHPPPAAIDRVAILIDPTPGRIVQHTLFSRPHPTPEQLSTLLARLGALMGHDRVGRPAAVDSYRPGAFRMDAFATEHDHDERRADGGDGAAASIACALRRFRHPVPARMALQQGLPVRFTSERRGCAGGQVVAAVGPWRTSGSWWADRPSWDRDEWDVSLHDGAAYRIFRDRRTGAWFIDAIVD